MADDKIIQQVELQGADKVQQDFKATGAAGEQAFDRMGAAADKTNFDKFAANVQQMVRAAQELSARAQDVSDSLVKQAEATDKVAQSSKQAADSVGFFSSNIGKIVAAVGVAVGSLIALRSQFDNVKNSMKEISDLASQASAAGVDFDEFQKLDFIFQSLGVSADKSRELIKGFASEVDDTATKAIRLSGVAKQLIENIQQQGVSFSKSVGGMNAMRNALVQQAQAMGAGTIPAEKLNDLLEKFKDTADPKKMLQFANALGVLATEGRVLAGSLGVMTETGPGGFGKVIHVVQQTTPIVNDLMQAFRTFKKETTAENFVNLANELAKITDEAERSEKAIELLGDELGGRLNRAMEVQKDIANGLAGDYEDLRLGIEDSAVAIADKFNRALVQLGFVTTQARRELALLIAPTLTTAITTFTKAIRGNRGALVDLISFIANTANGVLLGFIDLLTGKDTPIQGEGAGVEWAERARKSVISLGKSISTVYENVIKPAVEGAFKLFEQLAEVISKSLGIEVSGAEVGLVSIIILLLGPVNALIGAFAILFGLNEKGFQSLAEFLKKFDIDLNQVRADLIKFKDDFIKAFKGEDVDNEWAKDLVAILKALPAAILGAIAAFFAFRRALVPVATAMSSLFVGKGGRPITADTLLFGAVLGELSGAFTVLKGVMSTIAVAVATVGAGFFAVYRAGLVLGQIITGLVYLFGRGRVAAFGFAGIALLIIANWEKVKALLKTVGIDVDGITKKLDDAFEKDFGVRPLEALGRLWRVTFGQMQKDFEELKANLAKEGILSAAIDFLFKNDLPKFAEAMKEFVKRVKEVGFVQAFIEMNNKIALGLIEFFKPGGTLDQAIFNFFDKLLDGMLSRLIAKAKELVNKVRDAFTDAADKSGAPVPGGVPLVGGRGLDEFLPGAPESPNIEDRRAEKFDIAAMVADAKKAIDQLNVFVEGAVQSINELAKSSLGTIAASFGALTEGITSAVQNLAGSFNTVGGMVEGFAAIIQELRQTVPHALHEAFSTTPLVEFATAFQSMVTTVSSGIDTLIAKFNAMAEAARAAAAATASASGGGGGGGGDRRFQHGGLIGGRPGVDKNLILASADEFMIRARAVRKYGVSFMRAINEGRLKIPRFEAGGLIGSMTHSLAMRGPSMPSFVGAASSSSGREFIDLGLPNDVVIPVSVTTSVGRGIRDLAVRNQMNSIAKTTR